MGPRSGLATGRHVHRVYPGRHGPRCLHQQGGHGVGGGELLTTSLAFLYEPLLIDCTILYVKLITFHGMYDKLSTNIQ